MSERLKAIYRAIVVFLTILTGLIFFTFLTSPFVFKMIIKPFQFSKITKLSSGTIFHNYTILVNYLLNPFVKSLNFPNFTQSASGLKHFAEVKNLLLINELLFFIGNILCLFIFYDLNRTKLYFIMKNSFRFLSFIPLVLVILFVLFDFHNFFYKFHLILFRNSDWIFDPAKDPIINVLPEDFFKIEFIIFFSLWCVILLFFNLWINHQIKRNCH